MVARQRAEASRIREAEDAERERFIEQERGARRARECWILRHKREWQKYVEDLRRRNLPYPSYQVASGSRYGIRLPGYPVEVMNFIEERAEEGQYEGECVFMGEVWPWQLRPAVIRRVREEVRRLTGG